MIILLNSLMVFWFFISSFSLILNYSLDHYYCSGTCHESNCNKEVIGRIETFSTGYPGPSANEVRNTTVVSLVKTSIMSEQPKKSQRAGYFDIPGTELPEKRNRKMKQNALEFTVETKRSKAEYLDKTLWQAIRSAETLDPKSCTYNVLTELVVATQEFDAIVQELVNLYDQDKYGGEAPLVSENASLAYAHKLIAEMKNVQKSDKSSETMSVWSRNSRRSGALRASTSSSAVRMRAAGEAVAAKQQDEYERLITEKENEIKQREEEEDKRRQQARAARKRYRVHFRQ